MNKETLTQIMRALGEKTLLPYTQPPSEEKAWLAPVVLLDNEPTVLENLKAYGGDIYDLMEINGRELAEQYDNLMIYTCGWASPTNPDEDDDEQIAPSKHPERKRVALVCLATKEGYFGSAMRMWGNPEREEIVVENEGRGAMRDCAVDMWVN